jgi:hypothetical protein
MGGVAHVQADHVRAFGDQVLDDIGAFRRRAESAEDFGFSHGLEGFALKAGFLKEQSCHSKCRAMQPS